MTPTTETTPSAESIAESAASDRVKEDARANGREGWERKAFRNAAMGNAVRAVEALSKLEDKNPRNGRGLTPLFVAVLGGRASTVRALAAAGADPNVVDRRMRTPLEAAVADGDEEVVRALLDSGADPARREGARPLLDKAVEVGSIGLVSLLLDRGVVELSVAGWLAAREENADLLAEFGVRVSADKEEIDDMLFIAACGINSKRVERVLSLGANPNGRHLDGSTPLHLAMRSVSAFGDGVGVIRALLAAGADQRIVSAKGKLPIDHLLSADVDEGIVLELMEATWLDSNWPEEALRSLMFHAAAYSPALLGKLLDRGVSANLVGKNGGTPLREAAASESKDSVRCMEMLLAAGADPTAKDWYGYGVAYFCEFNPIKRKLLEAEVLRRHADAAASASASVPKRRL